MGGYMKQRFTLVLLFSTLALNASGATERPEAKCALPPTHEAVKGVRTLAPQVNHLASAIYGGAREPHRPDLGHAEWLATGGHAWDSVGAIVLVGTMIEG